MQTIKSPQHITAIQKLYAREIETRLLESLIEQFNMKMGCEKPNQSIYTIVLYLNRPAGFHDTSGVCAKFIAHCKNAGWTVKSAVINECQFTITVSPPGRQIF